MDLEDLCGESLWKHVLNWLT